MGSCVSVAEPVAFLGLLVPRICPVPESEIICASCIPIGMLFGAVLMLLADLLAHAIAFPAELTTGAMLMLIEVPCFIWLVKEAYMKKPP